MLKEYFTNRKNTDYIQIVTAFILGLLFGPISAGLAFYVAFIIVYEALVVWATERLRPAYKAEVRLALNVGAILGWVLGRWLYRGNTGYTDLIKFMAKW